MNKMNPDVEFYFNKAKTWQEEVIELRKIALDCNLSEVLKWGNPCYTLNGKNIVLIHVFKEYCALLFFKGALMQDPDGILIQQSENTQATKQLRFTNADEIRNLATTIKAYIFEAIEVEQAGLKVNFKKTAAFEVAEEFQERLDNFPALKNAFEALTPGRQRAYLLHFAQPKQSKTRIARIDKFIPHILSGKGLND